MFQNTLNSPVVNVGCWHVQCQKCWLISLVSMTIVGHKLYDTTVINKILLFIYNNFKALLPTD